MLHMFYWTNCFGRSFIQTFQIYIKMFCSELCDCPGQDHIHTKECFSTNIPLSFSIWAKSRGFHVFTLQILGRNSSHCVAGCFKVQLSSFLRWSKCLKLFEQTISVKHRADLGIFVSWSHVSHCLSAIEKT